MTGFDRLHLAVQHHVVNTLGWSSLRPLQEEAIEPILAGEHALLLAPTAGGKTEAAVLPLLSQMLSENWKGLTVLYLCPLRALLNNLHIRLERLAGNVGRTVALWHADVGDGERRRILAEPPDILLTTPESLEVMLVARRSHRHVLFGDLRVAVVDELHAFAGDDRGWHLLSVLERIARLAGRPIQRLGLSATIGNPDELLTWLTGSSSGARRVIAPEGWSATSASVEIDYVGSLGNAATVISRLHRGEKRLVFGDSRASVEELASALQQAGIQTYVSHSSLGVDERRRAEDAFAAGTDCVIVATSTLELGIDVGDLDRVIQIDAPSKVSSFLQRLGRTGRRAGTHRNCLFLATDDETLVQACGLIELWRQGYVEPVLPPPMPLHVFAQQLLGLTLQEGQLLATEWPSWIGAMPGFSAIDPEDLHAVLAHMVGTGILVDENGVLAFGPEGEKMFGGRNYPELFSVFASEPLFTVYLGRTELGRVHDSTFLLQKEGAPVLLLAGRSWKVTHIDWAKHEAFVESVKQGGKSRWLGSGQPLHFRLCRAIRRVLAGKAIEDGWSRRTVERMATIRSDFGWLDEVGTVLVHGASGKDAWWTFAGHRANEALSQLLRQQKCATSGSENLCINFVEGGADSVKAVGTLRDSSRRAGAPAITEAALEGMKFSKCVPQELAARSLTARLADPQGVEQVLGEGIRVLSLSRGAG